ncbi:MAG: T9SS type A sorting domain-containing protein [Candidatus Krumholzibacteriota bacterium]|nr:T9SS type A sorting domain-containing protein [Candidatus Krumholzibacteriota bacterium]
MAGSRGSGSFLLGLFLIFSLFILFFNPPESKGNDFSISGKRMDVNKSNAEFYKNIDHTNLIMPFPLRFGSGSLGSDAGRPVWGETGDHSYIELIGRWAVGPCLAVAARGDTAYFNNGAYLEIVDFSDPLNPDHLGKVEVPELFIDIALYGDYAYLADGESGLMVVDISNPYNPALVGSCDTPGSAIGVAVSGNYAYVTADSSGLRVIDVSIPSGPIEVGVLNIGHNFYGIAEKDNHVYVADYWDGLYVIDVSDPENPDSVGAYHCHPRNVVIDGNYAYLACYGKGLYVVDITDPSQPDSVGYYGTIINAYGVSVQDDHAYVAGLFGGMWILDISNPEEPDSVGYCSVGGWDIEVMGDYAYLANDQEGLSVIDITGLDNPELAGGYETGNRLYEVFTFGNYVYIDDGGDKGLAVLDISEPDNPIRVGQSDGIFSVSSMAFKDSHIFVAAYTAGLLVMDLTDPENPNSVGSYGANATANSVLQLAINGDYAYVLRSASGVTVLDITIPSNPDSVGNYDLGYISSSNMKIDGHYLYISAWNNGIYILDIADPVSPQPTAFYPTGGAQNIAVQGDYAYVACSYRGLLVLDVSDPENPDSVGCFDTDGDALDVAVRGSFAFVADLENGLRLIDISNPASPVEIGYYDTGGASYDVCLSGDYILVADETDGMYLFYTHLVDVLVQSKRAFMDEGSVCLEWSLSEEVAIARQTVLRKELPAGNFLEMDRASIKREGLTYSFRDDSAAPGKEYIYRIILASGKDTEILFETEVVLTPRLVFELEPNYPNPFNPLTTIAYTIPRRSPVTLDIFDISGRRITRLVDQVQKAGRYREEWNGFNQESRPVASGIYFYKLTAGKSSITRKMVLIK